MPVRLNRSVKVQRQQQDCTTGVGRDSVIVIIYLVTRYNNDKAQLNYSDYDLIIVK